MENVKKLEFKEAMDYKTIVTELWDLLDDIDTASDMFKPCETNGFNSYENFYRYAMKKKLASDINY